MIFQRKSDSEKTRSTVLLLIDWDWDAQLTHESRNIEIKRLQAAQEKLLKARVVRALCQRLTINCVHYILYYLVMKVMLQFSDMKVGLDFLPGNILRILPSTSPRCFRRSQGCRILLWSQAWSSPSELAGFLEVTVEEENQTLKFLCLFWIKYFYLRYDSYEDPEE